MAKQYTCEACGKTMTYDRETRLVEKVQEHAEEAHDTELEAEDIRDNIEDT